MDYSEDPVTAPSGGDLGYVPESALNQSQSAAQKSGSRSEAWRNQRSDYASRRIPHLKLMAKEAPGQRDINDPQVQQSIRDTFVIAKNSCCAPPTWPMRATNRKVTNYLAQQVMESQGQTS